MSDVRKIWKKYTIEKDDTRNYLSNATIWIPLKGGLLSGTTTDFLFIILYYFSKQKFVTW